MGLGTVESVLFVFSPGNLANTSAGAGYVGLGTLSACLTCVRDGCCDACCPMFSSEIFSAGFMGVRGPCRDLCCDACCDASTLRLVEALPLSERPGHTLGMLGAWGSCRDLCCDDGCDWWRPCPCLSGLATRLSTRCPRLLCWGWAVARTLGS